MIMQTGVQIPKSGFFVFPIFFPSTLLSPGRLKPATFRAWGVGQQFKLY